MTDPGPLAAALSESSRLRERVAALEGALDASTMKWGRLCAAEQDRASDYAADAVRLREQLEARDSLVALNLVPVEAFTGLCPHEGCEDDDCTGYGIADAVSAWSDCNRAIGRIYRVDDMPNREPGDSITVYVEASDRAWFDRNFGSDAPLPAASSGVPELTATEEASSGDTGSVGVPEREAD